MDEENVPKQEHPNPIQDDSTSESGAITETLQPGLVSSPESGETETLSLKLVSSTDDNLSYTIVDGSSATSFKLPEDVIPVHYDLDIITNLEPNNFSYEGAVSIKLKCLNDTRVIKFHSKNLTIDYDTLDLKVESEQSLESLKLSYVITDPENDIIIIESVEELDTEKVYNLQLNFKGTLNENLIGYYRSSYYDKSDGSVKRWLTVTHFEPSDARQAFPCLDEPSMKATFRIRLGHQVQYTAVSNMPLKATAAFEGKPGWVWSEFEKSLPMSTYLVAFMVSDFAYKESEPDPEPHSVVFRVWARKEAIDQSTFPSRVGPRFLSFYEAFFNVKYPLPKQDLVAVPDFKIGAMENWGMITFREASLLLDEEVASSTTKLHVATIIAHEIAHMWFGNLVTMRWWTDLWLKEGFATYMAGLAVHNEFPEWNSLDVEAISDLLSVFNLDSLKSSHPVSVPIGHPREISQIFDAISYDKGSFLLRMISLFLGEEAFRQGISDYLEEFKFSNAEQDELWACLTAQAYRFKKLPPDVTVMHVMDTWTLQTGYPLITVVRDYDSKMVTVSQIRYLAIECVDPQDKVEKWWVPLTFSTAKNPQFNKTEPEHWFPPEEEFVRLNMDIDSEDWMIFNNRAAGLYKVNYDSKNWQLIIDVLNSKNFTDIDVMNRALLIIDSLDLANSAIIDYEVAFVLISYLMKEDSFVPWFAAISKLEPIKARLSRTAGYGVFKMFLKKLIAPLVKRFGDFTKEPESFEKGRLIQWIMHYACQLDIGTCRMEAARLFKEWTDSVDPDRKNPIPNNLRHAVYALAVQTGGEDAWNFLWTRYSNANVASEKNSILMALTNAREVWLLDRLLEWTLDGSSAIRKQDAFIVFKMTANRDVGFYVAQKFFFRNIGRISNYFGASSNLIGFYFTAVAEQMIHQTEYDELKAFSEIYVDLLSPASLAVKQALESVQLNIRWMELHADKINYTLNVLNG